MNGQKQTFIYLETKECTPAIFYYILNEPIETEKHVEGIRYCSLCSIKNAAIKQ